MKRLALMVFATVALLLLPVASGLPKASAAGCDPGDPEDVRCIRDDATGGDCTLIGNWDSATKTCTLTRDVVGGSSGIKIRDDGVTLDGNGHSVTGADPQTGEGVVASRYFPWETGPSNVTIRNVVITNYSNGIALLASSNATIDGNTISDVEIGIDLLSSTGSTVENNAVSASSYWGIILDTSNNNTVTGNTITANAIGIYVAGANGNAVFRNTVSNNGTGIDLKYQSSNNTIYSNNFVGNSFQADNTLSGTGNVFNLPAPTGGNYWSDWTSPDNNHDGVVDNPYGFPDGADYLPRVRAIPPPTVVSPVDGNLEVTSYVDPACTNTKWCFDQWGAPNGEGTHGPGAICGANDTWSWDANLNTPAFDSDAGKWVYAVAEGTVAEAYGGECPNAGGDWGQVLIEHGNGTWWSGYLHMDPIVVSPGQPVHAGTPLGRISNVGVPDHNNHLHFVVYTGKNVRNGLVSSDAELVPNLGHSYLSAPAAWGTIDLPVLDTLPFRLADRIRINPGAATEEDRIVRAYASLVVDSPLQFNHEAGEPVVIIANGSPAVGGVAEVPSVAQSGDSSVRNFVALAGIGAAALALTAGAWYARRRWRA